MEVLKMRKDLLLPKMSENANIALPEITGIWYESTGKVLSQISDAIAITEFELKTVVSSIPDVWARPLLFWSALRDDNHPLHEKILQEWKGLLSLLALSKVKNYPIRFEQVKLGKDEFSNALKNLKPNSIQLEEERSYDWEDIIIIYYSQIPIGALSPATLVYTGSQYNQKLKNMPLTLKDESGFLHPPRSIEELTYVGLWLQNLYGKLGQILFKSSKNKDRSVVNKILELLSNWLKEIKDTLGLMETEEIQTEDVKIYDNFEGIYQSVQTDFLNTIKNYLVYQILLTPIVESDTIKAKSDLFMKFNSAGKKIEKVLIIHEQTLRDKNARIWGTMKLNDLGGDFNSAIEKFFSTPSGTTIVDENLEEKNALWIRPDLYFFTNTLIKSSKGKFLNESEQDYNNLFYIYPLKPEILEFFNPEEIKTILNPTFETKQADTVIFSIHIPLENGSKVKVSKTYRLNPSQGEGKILSYTPPVLEIFPDYFHPRWQLYYIFQNDVNSLDFIPLENAKPAHDKKEKLYKDKNLKITEMKKFPDVIMVINSENNEPCGLILLKKSSEIQRATTLERFIGVDLGTSNTNIYIWNRDSDRPEKVSLNFGNYLRKVTASESEIRNKLLQEYFIPAREVTFPTPTLLRYIDPSDEKEFFLNAFIYFQNSYQIPLNVISGFKWEAEDSTPLRLYIQSLLLLMLIDSLKNGFSTLYLGVTYPKAFSEFQVEAYKETWSRIVEQFNEHEFITLKFLSEEKSDQLYMYTESYSVGHFFSNEKLMGRSNKAYIESAAICVDVGGATSDIAIWYDSEICFDTSILLAGNDLIKIFRQNRKLRELLFSPEANNELSSVANQPSVFASTLNYILKVEEEKVKDNLLSYAKNPQLGWMRKMIAFQFGAIAYYIGMLIAYIEKNNIIKGSLIDTIRRNRISIHWGGNGAKLINWTTFGKFEEKGVTVKLLNSIFYESIKNNIKNVDNLGNLLGNIDQFQSPAPKDEASGGMSSILYDIIAGGKTHEETHREAKPIIGEEIYIKGKSEPLDPLSEIKPGEFFDDRETKFVETTLNKLNEYITLFNKYSTIHLGQSEMISFNQVNPQLIKTDILAKFKNLERTKAEKRVIEPVFIMEIKSIMDFLGG